MVNIFRDIEDQTPMLTRSTYDAVASYIKTGVLAPDVCSKLDFLVAMSFYNATVDIAYTLDEFKNVIERLPILLLCGGFAVNRLKRGMEYTPVPVHVDHFTEIEENVQKIASELKVEVVLPEGIAEYLEYVFQSGLLSRRYVVSKVDNERTGCIFNMSHTVLNNDTAPMKGRSNTELFKSLVADWQDVDLGMTMTFAPPKCGEIIAVSVLTGCIIPPISVVPSDFVYHGLTTFDPLPQPDDQYDEKSLPLSRLTSDDAALMQTEVRIITKSKVVMTATKLKLYTILRLLNVYYGKDMLQYCTNLKTLDLCASPGNMSDLLIYLGAKPLVQGYSGVGHLTVCTTIAPWFVVPKVGSEPSAYAYNITSHTDAHSYDLILADGYDPKRTVHGQIDLFWTEVYVALHKLAFGGTFVVKLVNTFTEVFGGPVQLTPIDVGHDLHVARFVSCLPGRARYELFSRFAHWSLVKPIGSSLSNVERYLVLMGYRPTPADLADYESLRSQFNDIDWELLDARVNACKRARASEPTQRYVMDDTIPNMLARLSFAPRTTMPIFADQDVDATIASSLDPVVSNNSAAFVPQSLTDAILWWGAVFTKKGFLQLLGGERVDLAVPSTLAHIVVTKNRYAQLAEYMVWCAKAISVNNHKAYMLEMAQNNGFANRFITTYSSEGPANNLMWRASVTWGEDGADPNHDFLIAVRRNAFTSGWCVTKKSAEQVAFRAAIGSYVGADIVEMPIRHLNAAGTRDTPTDNVIIGGADFSTVKAVIDGILAKGPTKSEDLRAQVRAICRGTTKKEISNILYGAGGRYSFIADRYDKIWSLTDNS